MKSLLASLVASRGWRPEPVATESLVHVLQFPEARTAFAAWADPLVPGLAAADLQYTGQVVTRSADGRPDVVGSTGSQVRVVIEAKFAAPLTAAQTAGAYIDHLIAGAPGLLAYLVPTDRVVAMWSAALRIHPDAALEELAGGRRLITPAGHSVTVLTWTTLLDLLATALVETRAVGDLEQLRGLVEWRSATQWVPILPDDLTDRVGRQIAGLSQMVLRAANRALPAKAIAGTSDGGPGRRLTSPGGRQFWVGIWYLAWGKYGHSPAWTAVKPTSTSLEALRGALADKVGRPAFIEGTWVAVPIWLEIGEEEQDAQQHLQSDIADFADALDDVGLATSAEEDV